VTLRVSLDPDSSTTRVPNQASGTSPTATTSGRASGERLDPKRSFRNDKPHLDVCPRSCDVPAISSEDTDQGRQFVTAIELVDRIETGGLPIAILQWPEDAAAAAELARSGMPRLFVLGPDAPPLEAWDDLEDWVRLPVDETDVRIRLASLRARAAHSPRPRLDGEFGRLVYGRRWVDLTQVQERLLRPLVEAFGQPVRDEDIINSAWSAGEITIGGKSAAVVRLKRRVNEVGLTLTRIHGFGYALVPLSNVRT
jgi:two-component system OmpR family response regulator